MKLSDDVPGRAADGMRILRELGRERHRQPLVSLVREVIDRLRLVEIAMLHPQGEQGAANILKVLDQARAYTDARPAAGLRGFVRWLRSNLERESDETDASISEDADDVVRILTAHASKGLEFPIVIFANMNTPRADRTNAIVSRLGDTPSFEMRIGPAKEGFCTPGFRQAEEHERRHAEAEQRRLLYVAATRARDHLVVPLVAKDAPFARQKKSEDPRSLNEHLRCAGEPALRGEPDRPVNIVDLASLPRYTDDPPPLRGDRISDATRAAAIVAQRDEWLAERASAIRTASGGLRVVTATSLKPEWEAIASQNEVRRGQATEFGVAVHAALERVSLEEGTGIDALCSSVAREYGFSDREDELAGYVRNALASPVLGRARSSPRLLRESPFTVAAPGGGLAEGRIDLLFIEEGQIVVVDFKSDRVSVAEASTRTHGVYRPQALAYAWAAHRATGLPVREVVFLYVRLPYEDVVPVDDAFMREAENLIAAPALT
jgi:ATP-dependent exoDNAse (exonuclease V) beta subunit